MQVRPRQNQLYGRPWQALLLGAAMLTPVGLAAGTRREMLTPLVARTNVDTTGN